jgi:hypothetical protein
LIQNLTGQDKLNHETCWVPFRIQFDETNENKGTFVSNFPNFIMFILRYLIISGTAKWHIDDQVFEAEAGKLIHHPPGAGTVYL